MIKKYYSCAENGEIKRVENGELHFLTEQEEAILESNRDKVFNAEHREKYDYYIIVDFSTGLTDIYECLPNSKTAHANRCINILQ